MIAIYGRDKLVSRCQLIKNGNKEKKLQENKTDIKNKENKVRKKWIGDKKSETRQGRNEYRKIQEESEARMAIINKKVKERRKQGR